MRSFVVLGAVVGVLAAGCASDQNASTATPASAASSTVDVDAAATTTAAVTTTAPTRLPTTVVTAAPTTRPTTTTTTSPPATTARPTTTAAPADDVPVTTAGALTPAFMAFAVSNIGPCPAPDVSIPPAPREVTVTWEVIGTESVYVAIDDVDGPFQSGLPPAGSITLPNSCPDGNTYYVVAENPEGRTVREATR